jgi:hypothetical protein
MAAGDLTQGRPAEGYEDFFSGEAHEQGVWWKRPVVSTASTLEAPDTI